jgi:hypothetical protein
VKLKDFIAKISSADTMGEAHAQVKINPQTMFTGATAAV